MWCPEELGAAAVAGPGPDRSFYELLPVQLGGAVQTIGADAAGGPDAELLEMPVGSPVLRCERVTSDQDGPC